MVALKTGATVTLKPDNPQLAARDGSYLQLYWGDAVDLAFALPAHVAESDVTESRVSVTGYYLRYSELQARAGADGPASARLRRTSAAPLPALAGSEQAPMCPVPAGRAPRLAGPL